jgi:hypothetical protein
MPSWSPSQDTVFPDDHLFIARCNTVHQPLMHVIIYIVRVAVWVMQNLLDEVVVLCCSSLVTFSHTPGLDVLALAENTMALSMLQSMLLSYTFSHTLGLDVHWQRTRWLCRCSKEGAAPLASKIVQRIV